MPRFRYGGYHFVGVWKETDSGVKLNPRVRSQVIALAQDLQIDAVLVTELTRWGRSTLDLIHTLQDLLALGSISDRTDRITV
jgi:DNA invertase Pin-like site-specific DNA recombinase